ncbi:MAG: isoaspartyl peptidase/L-asparaginase [Trueperaceae bacterium]
MAILLIHGGAGSIAERYQEAYEAGLRAALAAGHAALTGAETAGRTRALAAVLAAVTSMESNAEAFNAGVGGALTRDGTVELDACVMVSSAAPGARAGAVAGVRNTPNPILLADAVRRDTPHVLMIGAGAEALVQEPVANEALITPKSRASLERWLSGNASGLEQPVAQGETLPPTGSNTVGAVALDDDGNLAAATSTGGRTGQWSGRVGDAPIPGLGTYADERVAISCTGKGEAFMEATTAARLAAALEAGVPLEAAVQRALDDVANMDGDGGLIVVTAEGRLAVAFNSPAMAYGVATDAASRSEVAREPGLQVE